MNADYRALDIPDVSLSLFSHFQRRQAVNLCRRKVDDRWVIVADPFVDDWSQADYGKLVSCLKGTIAGGGAVFGAFMEGRLKGFASVEARPFGRHGEYLDLTSLHVSGDVRGLGLGRRLFAMACAWAKAHGAKKLYISAHSAVETQAFYRAVGCVDALEPNCAHVEREPYDCQLERML